MAISTSAHMFCCGEIQIGFDDTVSLNGTKRRSSPSAIFDW